jgi:hypothetical protein
MRLLDIDHEKLGLGLVLVVEPFEGTNLVPKGWSGEATENEDHRLLAVVPPPTERPN